MRFTRQKRLPQIGNEGQKILSRSMALVVGAGGLGSHSANELVRMGVNCRIVDHDKVSLDNLPRQVLYNETDIGQYKAEQAWRKLSKVDSSVIVECVNEKLTQHNIRQLTQGVDIIIDGTDDIDVRYLINDFAVDNNIPWVYGGVIATRGMVLPIVPGRTPCLRCLWPEPNYKALGPEIEGVIEPAVAVTSAMQCVEAVKILLGRFDEVTKDLVTMDCWHSTQCSRLHVRPDNDCRCQKSLDKYRQTK